MNESARYAKFNPETNVPKKIVTLQGAPDGYPSSNYWWAYQYEKQKTFETIEVDDIPGYNNITKSGRRHDCDRNKWEYREHIQSEADPFVYNWTRTVDSVDDCESCKIVREEREEEDRIEAEKEAFKDSIETVLELDDPDLSYAWSTAQIGKGKDNTLWIRYGSGCSCDWISDEDWSPFTEGQQAVHAVKHIGKAPHLRADFIASAWGLLSENQG